MPDAWWGGNLCAMPIQLALLRGINVGGHRKLPMATLRELCAGLGWTDVATWVQSGNVMFGASGTPAALAAQLQQAIERRCGFDVDVVVRSKAQWQKHVAANPFAAAAKAAPDRVLLAIGAKAPPAAAAAGLQQRGAAGEQVQVAGGALWFHYPDGVGRSKLTPVLIDRLCGTPMTARNCNTAWQLLAMLAEHG